MQCPKSKIRRHRRSRKITARAWRDRIRLLDNHRCRACKNPGTESHHIIYKSHGGKYTDENGILLCPMCHWYCHHGYSDNGTRITGRKYMLSILKQHQGKSYWRWAEAFEYLERRG